MTTRGRLALVALTAASIAAAPATRRASSRPSTTAATTATMTTGPATTQATTRVMAIVDPAAEPLLTKLSAAYSSGPLQIEGDIVGTFDVAGRSKIYTLHVIGKTDGSGRFLHDAASAGRIVSDGKRGTLFDRRRNAFAKFDTTAERVAAEDLEPALIDVLIDENPALLLTLTDDPAGVLRLAATHIRPSSAATSRPTTEPASQPATAPANGPTVDLVLVRETKTVTLHLDPADGTIRGSDIDFTPLMTTRQAVAVKAARATLTYLPASKVAPSPDVFVWEPPATASEFALHEELLETAKPTTRPRRR